MPLTPFKIPKAHHLIGGEWVKSSATLAVTDPSTGQDLTQIGRGIADEIDVAVNAAQAALDGEWGKTSAFE